jgi:hypothetical protein
MKHLATKISPFELALGIEAKQPLDLTIPRTKGTCCDDSKNVEKMAKDCEERKSWAIKLLEKMKVSYEKQTNTLWKHIEFEVGDLVHVVKHSGL